MQASDRRVDKYVDEPRRHQGSPCDSYYVVQYSREHLQGLPGGNSSTKVLSKTLRHLGFKGDLYNILTHVQ